jgi:hypothetical protein
VKRTIRKKILRAARAARRHRTGWYFPVTLTLDIPSAVTAGVPVWSPPGYAEIATARRWARRDGPGLCHAIVTTWPRDGGDGLVLASGTVTPDHLLGLGGLCDKPHRIRSWALPGSLAEEPLPPSHPAAAYQAWAEAAERDAAASLHPGREYPGPGDPFQDGPALERSPDGAWRLVIRAELGREPWLREDADLAAARIAALARHYGPGTRVRAYPWDRASSACAVTEPAYAAACAAF